MNTAALKDFAPAVRRQLLESVERKLDFALSGQTPDFLTTYARQVSELRELARADRPGLIERVAYTWFNRVAALRYLDARGWHPFRARVLMPSSPDETSPELLKLTRTGALPDELRSHTNPTRLDGLLDGNVPSADPQGEVYRHLVLAACRFYHALLPNLFERLDDATELLLPDDLLTEHSFVQGFRTEISDDDCAQVELLGWLYQFYISEKKDTVMGRKSAVPTEDIPAVTQLFTPHWIVRYLVENSLGRLWVLNRPGSRLRDHMPYYVEGDVETDFVRVSRPEEIRVLDPAVGSGHMLTYAFDLLYAIYEEEGYAPSEIPDLILTNNLHGVDICSRASQLAELALVFKAREKSRRFFQREHLVRPQILELHDVRFTEDELRDYVRALGLGDLFSQPLHKLLQQFEEAKNFGSLIQPCLDEQTIEFVRRAIEAKDLGGQLFIRETHLKVLRVLEQAKALTQRYHVIVANPPYMSGGMNEALGRFLAKGFRNSRADLSATFVSRSRNLSITKGYCALVTMQSWMFLSSLEAFRKDLISSTTVVNLAHFGIGAFPSLNSKVVQTVAFVLKLESPTQNHSPICYRLLDYDHRVKERQLLNGEGRFGHLRQLDYAKIGGSPVAYWISEEMISAFSASATFGEIGSPKVGMQTANNEYFLKLWHEVSLARTNIFETSLYWVKYLKGGPFRKWWGNNYYVLRYANDGSLLREQNNASQQPIEMLDRLKCSWTDISSTSKFGARLAPSGCFYDIKGHCFLPSVAQGDQLLGLANSIPFNQFLNLLNPGLNFQVGDVARVPLPSHLERFNPEAEVRSCISLARADWDNFETSWDFRDQPLLRLGIKGVTLESSWQNWESQSTADIRRMQELETEINRLFITAYGLDGELQPEVPLEQITLSRAEARRDMAAFLSYAVGCIMGRYGLDKPGLILAEVGGTLSEYVDKVGRPQDQLTFVPDTDGIIPVLDGEWFEDDIVARVREFLRVTFGESTLRENVQFIEESLGKDLRKYFMTDFYKDHLQTYKKRPIYWLVQSPKKGFSALIYLHRYTRDTINVILNSYLRNYLEKLRGRLEHLTQIQASDDTSPRDKTLARKEADKLTKILHECEEWERQTLLPLAQARIELDLDDGVKVNYLKLGEALAPIPGLAAKDDE